MPTVFVFLSLKLTESHATLVTLFYLGAKQKKTVQMKHLRDECRKHKLSFQKTTAKDALCSILGRYLFNNNHVLRVDNSKDICFDNLKLK